MKTLCHPPTDSILSVGIHRQKFILGEAMRRADRLMKITHFLRSRRRAVTAQQIADEFGISTRTVYRDVQDLMDTHVPISGEAGVGYMIDKRYYLPPVTFDPDELEALALGIAVVGQWTDEPFAAKAASAMAKISAALPPDLQGDLQQITTYSVPGASRIPWTISFTDLRNAIRDRQKIHITYLDLKERTSVRTLRPLALIFASPVWVVAAWCESREDFRSFRLDRITDLTVLDDPFPNDPERSLDAYKAQDGRGSGAAS